LSQRRSESNGTCEIEVTAVVDSADHMFAVPEFDPFSDRTRTTAVVDDIAHHLRSRSLRPAPAMSLSLLLPAAQVHDGMPQELSAALRRYAPHKLALHEREKAATEFEGRKRLPWGIVAVLVVLGLTFLLVSLFPETVRGYLVTLLTPVATVAIWVALWNPIEMLLHDRWELRRNMAIYSQYASLNVSVRHTAEKAMAERSQTRSTPERPRPATTAAALRRGMSHAAVCQRAQPFGFPIVRPSRGRGRRAMAVSSSSRGWEHRRSPPTRCEDDGCSRWRSAFGSARRSCRRFTCARQAMPAG
jgi:hypothetical protein